MTVQNPRIPSSPISFDPQWPISSKDDAVKGQIRNDIPIVVADDDPVSREVMSIALDTWGFKYTMTSDGDAAMTALRSIQGATLAILDWMMPGIDGLQMCRRIREMEKPVYIILLTVRRGTENLIEGLRAGANEYLVKPFDKDEMLARIQGGFRVLALQAVPTTKVDELQRALQDNRELRSKLEHPII